MTGLVDTNKAGVQIHYRAPSRGLDSLQPSFILVHGLGAIYAKKRLHLVTLCTLHKGVDPILDHEVPSYLSRISFDDSEPLPGVVFLFNILL